MKKLFKSISLIALTLILTLGLFGCGKKPVSVVNTNVNQNQNVNANTTTTTDNSGVSGWKVYTDTYLNFELKYPAEWENKIETTIFVREGVCFQYLISGNFNEKDYKTEKLFCIDRISKKRWNKELGDYLAERDGYVYFKRQQIVSEKLQELIPNYNIVIEKVISSFKFTEREFSTTDPNAQISLIHNSNGLAIYTNKVIGVRFNYEDKDNTILPLPAAGTGIILYQQGETPDQDMFLYIDKGTIPSDYSGDLKKYILEGHGWEMGQDDRQLISLQKLNYPNINEIYKVTVESMAVQRVNPKIVKGDRIFILNQNDTKEYLYVPNIYYPIVNQILSTFEFIK